MLIEEIIFELMTMSTQLQMFALLKKDYYEPRFENSVFLHLAG